MRAWAIACILLLFSGLPAAAVEPDEMLDDPQLEQRARDISAHLRCLVCQNQSIDDSNAGLARDLRILVRQRLTAGDSNEEVVDYIVDRYGEFVLLKPRFTGHNLILWLGPFLVLILGAVALWSVYRRRTARAGTETAENLSEEERKRLNALISDK